jgi:glycosyltransferase involved in cell wall biosynthesis
MWGQGRTYSTRQNAVAGKLKQLLTQRADWFFAYTNLGAEYVVAQGFPSSRTTVLWNSIDTTALQADLAAVSTAELDSFRSAHGLKKGNTALFLGGIDDRKGIRFLLESAREIGVAAPDFCLLVGGSGEMESVIARESASGGPVRYLGRLEGREKALALAAADFLMIPEWVGLVAVDSLAAGRPLVSTRHGSHSPEFEYLVEGDTLVLSEHEPSEYARAVLDLLKCPERLTRMSDRGQLIAKDLSIERMADNFVLGVLAWQSWLKSHSV